MDQFQFHLFFLQISAMLLVAWLFGLLMKKFGQSAVLGELLGGIALGPTLLGNICPDIYDFVFPFNHELNNSITVLLKLGLLFFMFAAGLEINLAHFRQYKKLIATTSLFSGVVPFALGFGLVLLTPQLWGEYGDSSGLAWFIGTIFSISALPVIARILIDLGLIESKIGLTIITSAMVNDVIGWALFSFILQNLHGAASSQYLSIIVPLLIYVGLMLTLGRKLILAALRYMARLDWQGGMLTLIAALILLTAAVAGFAGIHDIFAVFILGMVIGRRGDGLTDSEPSNNANSIIQTFSLNVFAPLYFVSVGLKVDLSRDFDPVLVLAILAIASVGKILGAGMGARLGGMTWREASQVGIGLNARGAIGLIFASVALEHGLIDHKLFTALVLMALITSLISGAFLKFSLAKNQ